MTKIQLLDTRIQYAKDCIKENYKLDFFQIVTLYDTLSSIQLQLHQEQFFMFLDEINKITDYYRKGGSNV